MRRSLFRFVSTLALAVAAACPFVLQPRSAAADTSVSVTATAPLSAPSRAGKAAPPAVTLWDEMGQLAHPVDSASAASWRRAIADKSSSPLQVAQEHVSLGEYLWAHDQDPIGALAEFQSAESITAATTPVYGLARYDSAIVRASRGQYSEARDEFGALLTSKTPGFSRSNCALWMRHAGAAYGYHASNSKAGIPEPPFLDPNCGIASLASSLRGLQLPFDIDTLKAACHVTGSGSSLADLIAGAPKLGVRVYPVQADETGLKALPKPCIAFVEHDHFVSVVRADDSGVSYLCSDCGPWPGGRVDLTWTQWRRMAPGNYGVVVKPGTVYDRYLSAFNKGAVSQSRKSAKNPSLQNQIASLKLIGKGISTEARSVMLVASSWAGHVNPDVTGGNGLLCQLHSDSLHCRGGIVACPKHKPLLCPDSFGPAGGDPVNLATGEEEYTPEPDITVYNPIGPDVVWSRIYNSEREGYGDNTGYTTYTTEYQPFDFNYPITLPNYGYSVAGWSQCQ